MELLNKKEQTKEKKEEIIKNEDVGENLLNINKSELKDLISPSGVDASHYDYLEIFSKTFDTLLFFINLTPFTKR